MKAKKTFVYCEYCGAPHEDISPPTEKQYQNGFIHIGNFSTVLLNNLKRKDVSHACNLEGVYCNVNCLASHIKKLRGQK